MAFFALFMLDTNLPSNYNTILIIKKEVLLAKNFEAFLESAPQIILQCSIIVRTGNISKINESFSTILSVGSGPEN